MKGVLVDEGMFLVQGLLFGRFRGCFLDRTAYIGMGAANKIIAAVTTAQVVLAGIAMVVAYIV